MRHINNIVIPLFLILAFTSCSTSMYFEPVMPGHSLPTPVVEDLLSHSIRVSLLSHNWIPLEDNPGRITARYEKSGGVIAVDIEITYDENGWTMRYIRSKNLDYNQKKSRIHKNYVRWINNLNKGILSEYMEKIG